MPEEFTGTDLAALQMQALDIAFTSLVQVLGKKDPSLAANLSEKLEQTLKALNTPKPGKEGARAFIEKTARDMVKVDL